MKGSSAYISKPVLSLSFIFFVGLSFAAKAGDFDRSLFDANGIRLDSALLINPPPNIAGKTARVYSPCSTNSLQTCITWRLVDSSANAAADFATISNYLSLWAAETNIRFVPSSAGISSSPLPLPYTCAKNSDGSNSNTRVLDDHGNPIMSGDFIISMIPPASPGDCRNPDADFVFGQGIASKDLKYIYQNSANPMAEILWAGIFLEPPNDISYLFPEMGRMIGLAPSAVVNSAMYPVQAGAVSAILSEDDILWSSSLYSSSAFQSGMGALSGSVISGHDGNPLLGAPIEIYQASQRSAFDLNRDLAYTGTFSRESGLFRIPNLPAGDYFVLLLSYPYLDFSSVNLLDSWLQIFMNQTYFEPDFYEGGGRESNHKPIESFSAQSIYYAATIHIVAGVETTGVELIANTASPSDALIVAPGSSNESLSALTPTAVVSSIPILPAIDGDGGGCALDLNGVRHFQIQSLTLYLLTTLALGLWLRRRRDLKAK